MNYFTLDSHKTTEWNIGLSGSGVWNAPARKGESIYLPGRNRAVWVDGDAWENIDVIYPCWIADGFKDQIDDFRAYMEAHSDQYYILTDTYHPNEYRLARYSGMFETQPGARNLTGRFNVVFDCDPRRLRQGAKYSASVSRAQRTATINYENRGNLPLYPIFRLNGASGGYRVSFANGAYVDVYNRESAGFDVIYDAETMTLTDNGGSIPLERLDATTSGRPEIPAGGATVTLAINALTGTQAAANVSFFYETEFGL